MNGRKLPVINSATGVSNGAACLRREYYRKLAEKELGIIITPSPWLIFGVRTHKILEDWLLKGTPPNLNTPEGRCANAGLRNIPPPFFHPEGVEGRTNFEIEGRKFVGIKDFTWPAHMRPEGHNQIWGPGVKDIPLIVDHKTFGEVKYLKTPEVLQEDIQANLYAYDESRKLEFQNTHVDLLWNNLRRTNPKDYPIYVRLELTKVIDFVDNVILPVADSIDDFMRNAKTPHDVDFDIRACSDYGGCPYKFHCKPPTKGRLRILMASTTMTLAERVAARNKAAKEKNGTTSTPPRRGAKEVKEAKEPESKLRTRRGRGVTTPEPEPESEPTTKTKSPRTKTSKAKAEPREPDEVINDVNPELGSILDQLNALELRVVELEKISLINGETEETEPEEEPEEEESEEEEQEELDYPEMTDAQADAIFAAVETAYVAIEEVANKYRKKKDAKEIAEFLDSLSAPLNAVMDFLDPPSE